MSSRVRIGAFLIAFSVLVFTVSLTLFCIALGLDFQNEGWSGEVAGKDGVAELNSWQLILSSIGFTASILFFFVGVQRVSGGPPT